MNQTSQHCDDLDSAEIEFVAFYLRENILLTHTEQNDNSGGPIHSRWVHEKSDRGIRIVYLVF